MLALVILALVACESASSFKFNKVTENQDRVISYPNIQSSIGYDYKLVSLNEQKKKINMKKDYLDNNIKDFNIQKNNLNREIEIIDKKKEYLDRKIDNLIRQKVNFDRETDVIYNKLNNLNINTDGLKRQKDQLDNEIENIDSEIEKHNTDSDLFSHKFHRAAVVDNEYRITIDLPGYNEREITVKTGRGLIVVQALRDVLGKPKRSFQDIRDLPYFVSENGSWSYKSGLLSIVLPVIERTIYKANHVVQRNGVIRRRVEKNYTTSTENGKFPKIDNDLESTTYVPNQDYDAKTTTQVTSQRNHVVVNDGNVLEDEIQASTQVTNHDHTDGKSEESEVKPTTYSSNPRDPIETNIYLSNKRGDRDTTSNVSESDDDVELTTPAYVPKQEDDVVSSTYIPNQESTYSYSVTTNNEMQLIPVV